MIEKPVAIVIPVHNSKHYLQIAIDCILNRTQYPFKIILIESESTDGTAELCDTYAEQNENIEVYHTPKEGIVKAINFGIDMAGDLDVYLTQDDVLHPRLYKRDWLKEMVSISKVKGCGAVMSINAGGVSGPTYLEGLPWAGTWSLFIPRKTINKIGKFDEKFSPGCGDDIDYSYRIFKAGLLIFQANFWVDHHRSTEHFCDRQQLQDDHAKYFRQKWKLGEFKEGMVSNGDGTATWNNGGKKPL
jgi:glycosyltransferase involved in cell wall biosynthesis